MSLLTNYWFDFLVVAVLVMGFTLGPKKPAMPQFLSALHWLLTFLICLFLYKTPAIWLSKKMGIQPDVVALMLFGFELLVVFVLLSFVLRRFKEKMLEKKAPFGELEPRVARVAGALRAFVFLFIAVGWISGRYVTEQDLKDHEAFWKENFGSISFPSLRTIRHDMFENSFSGRFAETYLSGVMMTAIPHVDLGDQPSKFVAAVKRTVKLRELDDNFEKESDSSGKAGKAGKDGIDKIKEPNAAEDGSTNSSGIAQHQIIYHDISLRGISGSGERLFALINDQTFQSGELSTIRFEDRKLAVQCLKILNDSVLIRFKDQTNSIELKLGIAVNLKGEPILKN